MAQVSNDSKMGIARYLLNCRDAARALAISERNLWSRTQTGEIPHVRIGRSVRYCVRDLEAWIDAQKEGGQP
jgi:predicted DNA-binding transcriptional regulator AlpA